MDSKDTRYESNSEPADDSVNDSGIFTDEESARQDFATLFSGNFTNIRLLYSSPRGATEIHTATRYGKLYILKGLKEEYRDDPIFNMCLAKEFEIGISLDHPYIRRTVGLEEVNTLGKRIILEYIDGRSLADILTADRLNPESAREISRQIAGALSYLHRHQICHRDLKPENILFSHNGGNVKIIDFNLADRDDYVILKNPAGTPVYMAPEQKDSSSTPTPEADIYSLGVILEKIAASSGDKSIRYASRLCMDPNPTRRRDGMNLILNDYNGLHTTRNLAISIIDSKAMTYILSAVCIILLSLIFMYYFNI